MKPLWPAEGRGPEPGLPLRSPGQRVGEPGPVHVSVGAGGRNRGLLPPGPGLPEHGPVQVPVARLGPQPPVRVVSHPPLLPAAVGLPPRGKGPGKGRGELPALRPVPRCCLTLWAPLKAARDWWGVQSSEKGGAARGGGRGGTQAPEEARLVDNVVLLHHFAPVSLKLLDPSLLGLGRLYVPLLQVPGHPDFRQWNHPTLRGPQINPRLLSLPSSALRQVPSP